MQNSKFALKKVKPRMLLLEKSEIFWNQFWCVHNVFCNAAIGSIIVVCSLCRAGNMSKFNRVIQILNDPKQPMKHYVGSGRSKRWLVNFDARKMYDLTNWNRRKSKE